MLARQIAIGFGIALIFPLLVYYGVATFHGAPNRQDFFRNSEQLPQNATPSERKEYNDRRQAKSDAFDAAARAFAKALVIVSTPLGVAAIFIGAYLALHAIGTGLILGGIFTVAWGYWNYWSFLEDWLRFASLLAGFAILLFVGYRRIVPTRPNLG